MADLSIRARNKIYSDMDFAFRANPITGDVSIKKDVEAVKQSVLNILLTNRGEKPFEPTFGSGIRSYLFENVDGVTETLIREDIIFSLNNFEPRVIVEDVTVTARDDSNQVDISLTVNIINPINVTTAIEFTLERLR